jgi:hypothetical protein
LPRHWRRQHQDFLRDTDVPSLTALLRLNGGGEFAPAVSLPYRYGPLALTQSLFRNPEFVIRFAAIALLSN